MKEFPTIQAVQMLLLLPDAADYDSNQAESIVQDKEKHRDPPEIINLTFFLLKPTNSRILFPAKFNLCNELTPPFGPKLSVEPNAILPICAMELRERSSERKELIPCKASDGIFSKILIN